MKNKSFLTTPYFIWIVGFTIIPLFSICIYAFTDSNGSITFDNILAITNALYGKSLILSIELALATTVLCLILAYPLALILKKYSVGKKGFVAFLFILPMWMNFILRVLAMKTLLANNGIINAFLELLHLPTLSIINTPIAVVLGMIYDYLPFMLLPIYNSVVKIDSSLIEAAKDLGADNKTVFRKIILPCTMPGVISGITMVFVPSMTSFVIPDLLGGGKVMLIGNIIEQEFTQGFNWHLGSGLSITLVIFIIASMVIFSFVDKDKEGGAASLW